MAFRCREFPPLCSEVAGEVVGDRVVEDPERGVQEWTGSDFTLEAPAASALKASLGV